MATAKERKSARGSGGRGKSEEGLRFADAAVVLDSGGSGADIFCRLDEPGVLHVSGVPALAAVDCRWSGEERAGRMRDGKARGMDHSIDGGGCRDWSRRQHCAV